MTWIRTCIRASSCGQTVHKSCLAGFCSSSPHGRHLPINRVPWASPPTSGQGARRLSSLPEARTKRALDIDTLVSVLEVSANKRDLKGYLQKYTGGPEAVEETTALARGQVSQSEHSAQDNIAIVKIRRPQILAGDIITGIAKTLSQLRALGLLSILVVDCGVEESRDVYEQQSLLLCEAIDSFSKPGAKLMDNLAVRCQDDKTGSHTLSGVEVCIDDYGALEQALRHGLIPVIPSLVRRDILYAARPAPAHQVVVALTSYLVGMQFKAPKGAEHTPLLSHIRPRKIASVERVIILDPLGGIPVTGRPGASHRFVNLEQEYDTLLRQMTGPEGCPLANKDELAAQATVHGDNLSLAKDTLSVLPSSSSVLVTTPYAAANTKPVDLAVAAPRPTMINTSNFGFNVNPKKKQNPLLHSLLTDKPIYSSSLPIKRSHGSADDRATTEASFAGTLIKRGMPLTIFPDPRQQRWKSPGPNEPRLRLTDTCIDLPRLVHLIEDSFGRRLDVSDYLDRVKDNLAGIIIAGEYEGAAILTWETPGDLDAHSAYEQGRLVPYLDKFAVLKSRQGSGGVADIVFNAMVRDCFPDGVCWRSRKNNPVNKWYFERSAGTNKLDGCDWSMFWTTLMLDNQHPVLQDYEAACRKVEPSWADNKHILD